MQKKTKHLNEIGVRGEKRKGVEGQAERERECISILMTDLCV